MNYELHPLCTLFPRITGKEFEALVADIKANGLREPIIIHDGMILDGGNRYRACIEAGVEPAVMKFGGGNLVTYVLSANLHRRHLSPGQQAAIVSSAQDWGRAQGDGKPGNIARLDTRADRAAMSGASDGTQKMADKVAKSSPELAKQVGRGEISLPKAVEQITGKRQGAKPETEVKSDETQELRAHIEELTATAKELLEENASMGAVMDADDKLAALTAENKKLRELNRVIGERLNGLQNECNEAKRAAKMWRAKFDKQKKLAA